MSHVSIAGLVRANSHDEANDAVESALMTNSGDMYNPDLMDYFTVNESAGDSRLPGKTMQLTANWLKKLTKLADKPDLEMPVQEKKISELLTTLVNPALPADEQSRIRGKVARLAMAYCKCYHHNLSLNTLVLNIEEKESGDALAMPSDVERTQDGNWWVVPVDYHY